MTPFQFRYRGRVLDLSPRPVTERAGYPGVNPSLML
jgi:hypothetical protein